MSDGQPDDVLRVAVLEWQKKYGIRDGDPLLAALELFQIHLASMSSNASGGVWFPAFLEFRDSIELLDRRSKSFSKHACELTEALRAVPNIKQQLRNYRITAFVLTALCALFAGILIGKFVL